MQRRVFIILGSAIALVCAITLAANFALLAIPSAKGCDLVTLAARIKPGPAFTIIAAIASLQMIAAQIREARRVHRHSRATDVIMHCNQRYEQLIASSPPSARMVRREQSILPDVRSYWRRYWGIKADQFDHYISGLVDRDTMTAWQVSTVRHFQRDVGKVGAVRGGVSARQAWAWIGLESNEANPWFVTWIQHLLEIADQHKDAWDRQEQPSEVHKAVISSLEKCEAIFDAWRSAAEEGSMDIDFYRKSLTWPLPLEQDYSVGQLKDLRLLRRGVPIEFRAAI